MSNSVLALLDKEDITFFTEQEKILNMIKKPLVQTMHTMSETDIFSIEPVSNKNFFYQAVQARQKLFSTSIDMIEMIAKDFVSSIETYFKDKYDVSIDLSLGESFDFPSLSMDTIYEKVEKVLAYESLKDTATQQLKESLKQFGFSQNGRMLEVHNEFSVNYYGNHLSSDSVENLKILFKGLSLYETGNPNLNHRMTLVLKNSWKQADLDLKKVEKFKTFKNGKFVVAFKTIEEANSFLKFLHA